MAASDGEVSRPDARPATADRRSAVATMLEARSVAVVGASVKPGSLGRQMMLELARGGFDGAVYPVNPGYDEIEGFRCYASVADLPEPVDLAILGVASHRVEQSMREAASAGARSATTFASLYEEASPASRPPLTERVASIAREHRMALCGGNGMGFVNLEARLRATGFPTPEAMRSGPVAFVSHSGSAFSALAFSDRGIGFNVLISSGQEIVTDCADYMEYALGLDSTRVIALFIETVRDPDRFRAMLALAHERDVSVVALKVGRSEGSAEMIAAHSGALAGEDGAYEALFDAYGVLRVATMDEMVDAVELLCSRRRVQVGSGIASLHDSGGERVMFADVAHDVGVPFARISDATRERIQAVLDPGLVAANPLDAWGTGIDHERIFTECFHALHDDPQTSALAFVVDLTPQGEPYDEGYLQIARDVFASTDKPFCVLSNLASTVATEEARLMRDEGIPVLEGTDSGLRALGHLLTQRRVRERPPLQEPDAVTEATRRRWRDRLASGSELDEVEGLALLADYGIPTIESARAASAGEALEAAAAIGWPVAVKTAVPGVTHKSDVKGVHLGVAGEVHLRSAYTDLAGRLGPEVTVAAMAPHGVELALGVVRDAQFGPLVLVAAGGVLVEVLHDRRLALPPLDEARARSMVDRLQVRPLLEGARGDDPADLAALDRAIVRLSRLALDLGDVLDAVDVNPLIVGVHGCIAVDALVVPRSNGRR